MSIEYTDDQISAFKDYALAKKHLRQGREFADWMKIARGYDNARNLAMKLAKTNVPHGAAYREHFAAIDRKWKLIDRDNGHEWPSKEDRTYCIKVLENFDMPSYDPRRKSIKEWRAGLAISEAARLNHPKNVWNAYWSATEPRAEKDAKRMEREMRGPKPNKMLEAVATAEVNEHAARRETEALRELLAYIRDFVQLPDEVVAKINKVLGG